MDQQAHRLHQRELDATKSGTSSATPRTTPRVRTASQSKRNYSIKQNQKSSGKNTSKYFKRRSEHREWSTVVEIFIPSFLFFFNVHKDFDSFL